MLMISSEVTMDELAEAQAELARLQRTELDLLSQLFDVRAAAEEQKRKIATLLGITPLPPSNESDLTHRLPTELLSRVLGFALCAPPSKRPLMHGTRKRELASVSRRWRDTILNDPHFWTSIFVQKSWSLSLVEVYLTRSRDCVLDIDVYPWTFQRDAESQARFLKAFNTVLAHACRWRSIMVDRGPLRLDKVATASFPSLVRSELHDDTASRFLSYLGPARSPALRHVVLKSGEDATPSRENTAIMLMLGFGYDSAGPPLRLRKLSSLVTLTSLSLVGSIDISSIRPDSVHLPHLESLFLKIPQLKELLEAFVAPKLESLNCLDCKESRSPSGVFGDIQSKYANVRRLSFHLFGPPDDLSYEETEVACMTFPNVRHVVIPPRDITSVFFIIGSSECPADVWEQLESITITGGQFDREMAEDDFQRFLRKRKRKGRPLTVKFSEITLTPRTVVRKVYMELYKYCSLEMEDIPVPLPTCLSLKTGCPARVVRIFPGTYQHHIDKLYPLFRRSRLLALWRTWVL